MIVRPAGMWRKCIWSVLISHLQPAKFAAAKGNCRRNCLRDYWVRQQKIAAKLNCWISSQTRWLHQKNNNTIRQSLSNHSSRWCRLMMNLVDLVSFSLSFATRRSHFELLWERVTLRRRCSDTCKGKLFASLKKMPSGCRRNPCWRRQFFAAEFLR